MLRTLKQILAFGLSCALALPPVYVYASESVSESLKNGSAITNEQIDIIVSDLGAASFGGIMALSANGSSAANERVVSFSGSNRLETAAMEALHGRESSEWVVVVGSDGWPDALSASGLAGALSAPILLTDAGALSDEAAGAISELGAARAVVVGGESAVSASAVAGLEAAGLEVDRVAGADRYETQRSVFAYGRERGLWGSSYVLAASGENFADALSLAPVAYAEKAPVFLVGADGDFSAAQYGDLRLCASAPAGTALAAGGEAVMSERALGALRVVAGEVVRLAGENRYETSAEVAAWAVSRGVLSWDGVALASGESPYDALAGSAVQGSGRSVLLLASDTSGAASVLAAHRQSISQVKFFGGPAAFSNPLRWDILNALGIAAISYQDYDISLDHMVDLELAGNASYTDSSVRSFLDPSNFTFGDGSFYQFAILDGYTGMFSAADIDEYIDRAVRSSESTYRVTSTMRGMGAVIIAAAEQYDINEIYLMSHAALESAWGCSQLSQGSIKGYEGYYNFFGIGAYDIDPNNGGAALAKKENWSSPAAAINGAARWISENYIGGSSGSASGRQNTLYKMKWDVARAVSQSSVWHQYATATHWAVGIANVMNDYYSAHNLSMQDSKLVFEVPRYRS